VGPSLESLSYDTIIYRPRAGGTRTIKGIIDFAGPAPIGALAGGSRPVIDIYFENSSVRGISSAEVDTGGDKLDLPQRYGLAAKTLRIIDMPAQDRAIVHLRAQ